MKIIMPFVYIQSDKKKKKKRDKGQSKQDKKQNKKSLFTKFFRRQHTKVLLDILMVSFVVVCISSMYINFKNGFSMDGILTNICDVMKWILPTGCAKSVVETALEKKARMECKEKGFDYDEI